MQLMGQNVSKPESCIGDAAASAEKDGTESETVILFADIIGASEISNNVSLEMYANIIHQFHECARNLLFKMGMKEKSEFYECSFRGDEICMMFHRARLGMKIGDKHPEFQDAYNIRNVITFAISLKILWFMSDYNMERMHQGLAPRDIGIGVNLGRLYRFKCHGQMQAEGYAINLAKRIESASRKISRSKVLCSETVASDFQQKAHLLQDMVKLEKVATPLEIKGISTDIGIYAITEINAERYGLFYELMSELFINEAKRKIVFDALKRYADGFWNRLLLDVIGNGLRLGKHELNEMYQFDRTPCALSLNEAKMLIYLADYRNAKIYLERLERENPDCIEAIYYQAVALENREQYREAAEKYRVVACKPNYSGMYCQSCKALVMAGEYTEAIADINKAIAIHAANARFHYCAGIAYATNDDFKMAIAEFNTALKMDDGFSLAWANLGFVELLAGNRAEAERDFGMATIYTNELFLAELGIKITNEYSDDNDIRKTLLRGGVETEEGNFKATDINFTLAIKYWNGVLEPKSICIGEVDLDD